MELTLPVVTIAAIIDSFNPCAISVLLLTLGFLLSLKKDRSEILKVSGFYILAIFLTYILIGIGVLSALTFFGIPQALSKFGAIIIITTGLLNLFDSIIPNFPIKLAIPAFIKPELARQMQKATLPAIFSLGILVGLFEFPCTGGPYLLILSLLHDRGHFLSGFAYLIYYNLIFVSPLIILLYLGSHPKLLSKIEQVRKINSKKTDLLTSLAMIILGILIYLL